MPDKPIHEGFKFFVAGDYLIGVCFRINLDDDSVRGKSCEHMEWGATGQYILELLRDLPGRGYKEYVENFYSSPALFYEAKIKYHVYLIGTLRTDRGVHPADVSGASKPTTDIPKGTCKFSCSSNQMLHLYGIMDSKVCYILDAAYGSMQLTALRRRNKDGSF